MMTEFLIKLIAYLIIFGSTVGVGFILLHLLNN
jgi:hypothetical protein